jgi:hypothetical protein
MSLHQAPLQGTLKPSMTPPHVTSHTGTRKTFVANLSGVDAPHPIQPCDL